MPGNPLTDPNWAPELADTVERVVGTVREKTTDNAVKAARIIVFGLLAAFLGLTAVILLVITFTRGLQILLDFAVTPAQAVYISYFIVGGILLPRRSVVDEEASLRRRLTASSGSHAELDINEQPGVLPHHEHQHHRAQRHHHRFRPGRLDGRRLRGAGQPRPVGDRG